MDFSSDSLSPVELLAEEFLDRQQRGENPTIEEYCRRHPDLEDEIRDVFDGFLLIENLKPGSNDVSQAASGDRQFDGKRLDRVGDYRIIREVGRGGMGVVYEAEQESLRRRVALKVLPIQHSSDEKSLQRFQREARAAARMHHTNIVPVFEVGQDDQWVFYAMQLIQGQGLDLVIDDLKRIRTEHSLLKRQKGDRSSASPNANQPPAHSIAASLIAGRFQQEDLAGDSDATEISAAEPRLSQTGVSDSDALRAYAETTVEKSSSSVSAVLPGQSEISSAESNRNEYFHSVAQIGLQTAWALSYAHARGIIHRDIKPSNLLLDAAGIVWVTDFGLAKTSDEAMTHTGDILGTIRYMSPERFRGQCDVRADIYSLGLTLYEMLVLKPAFSSPDRLRLIEMVTKADPELPRSLDAKIPRDLETIVLKCIDKDARRRYQSADELADDLQRFVDDEPIKARRISLAERFGRWSRRNRGLATSLAVVALLLLIINIAGPILTWRMARLNNDLATTIDELKATQTELKEERDVANALQIEAENGRLAALKSEDRVRQQQELTRRNLYFSHIHMAQAAGDFARREQLLNQWRTSDPAADLRGFEWYYLSTQSETPHEVLRGHTDDIRSVTWSPDGSRAASGARDNQIKIWDAATGRIRQTLTGHRAGVWGIDWSPDGARLATASTDSSVRIWDAESGQELLALDPHSHYVFDVAWSPDGRQIASASWDKTVRIWDAVTGQELATLDHVDSKMWCVAWHPNGELVATGGNDDSVIRVWDVAAKQIVETFTADEGNVASLAWHRDGMRLASSSHTGDVFIWERGKQHPLTLKGHEAGQWVDEVAWHPIDEDLLLTSGGDRTLHIWNVDAAEIQLTLRGHEGGVRSGRWSPDGTRVLSCSGDRTLRLWDISSLDQRKARDHHDRPVNTVDWSPDGGLMATGSSDGTVKIWGSGGTKLLHELTGDEREIRCLRFSPDGKLLATGGYDGFVRLWDVHSGELVCRSEEKHNPQPGNPQHCGVECLAWHPEGASLTSGGQDNVVRFWDASTGKLLDKVPTKWSATYTLGFSPDGRWMASGHWIGTPVIVWDTANRTIAAELDDRGIAVRSVQFSPDGMHLVAAGGRNADADNPLASPLGVIRVWQVLDDQWTSDAEPVTEILSQSSNFAAVSWSPDGRRLASTNGNGEMQLWDVSPTRARGVGRELLRLPARSGYRTPVCFSPDGSRIAVSMINSIVTYDAFAGYAREKSPKLLPTLDARIRKNTATVDDYLLRAEVFSAAGNWDQAAEVYEQYYQREDTKPWVLSDTWVAGYFPGDLDTAYEAEQVYASGEINRLTPVRSKEDEIHWKRIEREAGGPLVFNRVLGPSQQSTAYAFQRIYSPRKQEVGVLFGDDDYHRLWVNEEVVSEDAVTGPANPQEFAVPVTLRRGWNSILAKVVNAEGDSHGLFLRVTNDSAELAAAYVRSGQFDRAAAAWDRAVRREPDDKSLVLRRGMASWRAGDQTGAETDFEAFLSGRENDAMALEQRAKAYLDLGRIDEGHADYDRAVAVRPDWLSLRSRCMRSKMEWNRPHEAVKDLKYLQENDPTEHHHYVWLAPVLLEVGDVAGYEQIRNLMLRRWSRESNAMLAERTAVVCLLRPANEQDLDTAARLADLAAQSTDVPKRHWHFMTAAGLAKYRQGEWAENQGDLDSARQHFSQAHADLESAIANLSHSAVEKRALARFLLAATSFHLKRDDVSDVLEAAEKEYRALPQLGRKMADVYICRTLRAEAQEKILGPGYGMLDRAEQLIAAKEFNAAIQQIEAAMIASPGSEIVVSRAAQLFERLSQERDVLSRTSESEPVEWQYRFTTPPSGWESGLETDNWKTGSAPFSTRERASTAWPSEEPEVWIRRQFDLPAVPDGVLRLRLLLDDRAQVYLNGNLVITRDIWTGNRYSVIEVPVEATRALRPGTNVLAVHASNNLAIAGPPNADVDVGVYVTRNRNAWSDILSRASEAAPDSLPLIKYRAYENVRRERYLEAGLDYARFAPISDQPENHLLNTASLLALSGDVAAYRDYCNELLTLHEDLTDPAIASKLIKACLLIPDATDTDRLPIELVRRATASTEQERPNWWHAWAHGGLALAAYRSGDLSETQQRIELVEELIGDNPAYGMRALISPLKAMVEHQRQDDGRAVISNLAQESLSVAKESIDFHGISRHAEDTLVGTSLLDSPGGLKHNAIIGEVLRREAKRLVGHENPPGPE